MARMVDSLAAEPIHTNLRMSNFAPSTLVNCAIGRLRLKVPMVSPSGFATLYTWFAAMRLCPRHVLHDHRRLARDVLRQVTREQAGGGVVSAARLVADDDGDGFARIRLRQDCQRERGQCSKECEL